MVADFLNTQNFTSPNPGKVPLILILVTAAIAYWTWRSIIARPVRAKRRQGALAALIVLGFAFMDWALLAALPALGLSYGPVGSSLGLIAIARALLYLVLLVCSMLWLAIRRIRFWLSQSAGSLKTRSGVSLQNSVPLSRRSKERAVDNFGWFGLSLLFLMNLGLLAGEIYTMYIEPFDLRTTRLSLEGPPVSAPRPLRIVHLSDLHVERITKREHALIAQVDALQPDLILLTGDYPSVDYLHDLQALQDTKAVLDQLHASQGVYAVPGSVDNPEVLAYLFKDSHIRLLQDDVQRLPLENGEIYLVGISDLGRQRDSSMLRQLMAKLPEEAYSILLYHRPDLVEAAAETNVDLYLAGHTHGGQVRLPWYGALVTGSAYGKQYESGLYNVGQTTLYVSRGVGMEGLHLPRLRFLCPPEIVIIDLGSESAP